MAGAAPPASPSPPSPPSPLAPAAGQLPALPPSQLPALPVVLLVPLMPPSPALAIGGAPAAPACGSIGAPAPPATDSGEFVGLLEPSPHCDRSTSVRPHAATIAAIVATRSARRIPSHSTMSANLSAEVARQQSVRCPRMHGQGGREVLAMRHTAPVKHSGRRPTSGTRRLRGALLERDRPQQKTRNSARSRRSRLRNVAWLSSDGVLRSSDDCLQRHAAEVSRRSAR